jgi:PleD family two-component response regulator
MQNDSPLAVMDYSFTQPLLPREWQILQQMHMNFCFPFKNALEHHKIKKFAMKDFLTSLGNRASYNETIVRMANHSHRRQQPFGLIILDIDNFKQVNDAYGHQEGDKASESLTLPLDLAVTNFAVYCQKLITKPTT